MRPLLSPLVIGAILLADCRRTEGGIVRLPSGPPPATLGDEPPVAVNFDGPVEYPAALFSQGIEGTVLLRLYVDEQGRLVSDSVRIAESSGYPALDSAAVAAVPKLRFVAGRRGGIAVAGAFLQPVHFRHPELGGTTP